MPKIMYPIALAVIFFLCLILAVKLFFDWLSKISHTKYELPEDQLPPIIIGCLVFIAVVFLLALVFLPHILALVFLRGA